MRRLLILPCLLALTACTQFPELDTAGGDVANAAYPELVPLDRLLTGREPQASLAVVAGVQGRVGALQARAARLQRLQATSQRSLEARVARLRQKAAALRAQ